MGMIRAVSLILFPVSRRPAKKQEPCHGSAAPQRAVLDIAAMQQTSATEMSMPGTLPGL
jgi:hypothetical protein